MHQFIFGAVLCTSLLAACATTEKPPSLSVSSGSQSSDIVIRRSAAASKVKLTNSGSPAVDENNRTLVNSVIASDAPQKKSAVNLSNRIQNNVATSAIDTIIWQIQTGTVPPSPVDPVLFAAAQSVPRGQEDRIPQRVHGAPLGMFAGLRFVL